MNDAERSGLWVLVATDSPAGTEGRLEEQSLDVAAKARTVARELLPNIADTWASVTTQLGNMLSATRASVKGFDVDAVTVKLGIDGKGSIGVVSAGVSAAFEVTFTRSTSP
ncbi:MAG: hypothetical protein JO036_11715 [Candidatus Eremiobacteraeota bacterium]|nr:hypothetical protein [Candidatus Eremiobacteraeota bacterium]